MLGLHHNTVREHLEALVSAGFVSATAQPTGRRGRPALAYTAVAPDPGEVLDSYLTLLDVIAQTLGSGEDAERLAHEIGRRWAHETTLGDEAEAKEAHADPAIQEPAGQTEADKASDDTAGATNDPAQADPAQLLDRLLPALNRMGFAPEPGKNALVLRACPLVTGTRVPHDMVCRMHEGFLNEALASVAPQEDPQVPGERPRLVLAPLRPDGCHLRWQR